MGGSMSSVVPGIYIGGLSSVRSEKTLEDFQITHICSVFQYPISVGSKWVHKQFVLSDSPDEDISKFFIDASDFVHGARINNGTVLIHCACGISRSVSLTIAYLIAITDFDVMNIYKAVRAARLGACPNPGFIHQLLRFQACSGHLKAREFLTLKYGPWPEERQAADATYIRRLIAGQDEFIATGYHPWDMRPSKEEEKEDHAGRNRSIMFTYRLPDRATNLHGALRTRQPTPPNSGGCESAEAADSRTPST